MNLPLDKKEEHIRICKYNSLLTKVCCYGIGGKEKTVNTLRLREKGERERR